MPTDDKPKPKVWLDGSDPSKRWLDGTDDSKPWLAPEPAKET